MKQHHFTVSVGVTVKDNIAETYPNFSSNYGSIKHFAEEAVQNSGDDEWDAGFGVTVRNVREGLYDNNQLLLSAVQFMGFALTENMPDELEVCTAIETLLIHGDEKPLRYLMEEKPHQ